MDEHRSRRRRLIGIDHLVRARALRPALVLPSSFAVASASGPRTTSACGGEKRRRHQHGGRHMHLARLGARSSAGPPARVVAPQGAVPPGKVLPPRCSKGALRPAEEGAIVHVIVVWRLGDAREHGKRAGRKGGVQPRINNKRVGVEVVAALLVYDKETDEVTHVLAPEAPAVRDRALRVCHFVGEAEVACRRHKRSRGVLGVDDLMLDPKGAVAPHNLRAASAIPPRMRRVILEAVGIEQQSRH
eukprot:scaffold32284_cov29-Phaeocystis_antarctica.AAC.2